MYALYAFTKIPGSQEHKILNEIKRDNVNFEVKCNFFTFADIKLSCFI
jgi:hypothetical protein